MDSRIAAELLYESEATLRMVDDALDELCITDADPRLRRAGLPTAVAGMELDTGILAAPSDFCVRAYWQIQDLLECVRQSREALQSLGRGEHPEPAADGSAEQASGIDRALALVDRLDTLDDDNRGERQTLHADLRRDLIEVMNQLESRAGASESLSAVALQLAEAEARLTKLGHVFESGDA